MTYPITPEAIAAINAAGFDVYMRKPSDTYALFTDGMRIGYIQHERFRGYSLSTVHKPNRETGTGFKAVEGLSESDLTAEKLEKAFAHAPSWAPPKQHESVKKYKDMTEYLTKDSFNAGYTLISARA